MNDASSTANHGDDDAPNGTRDDATAPPPASSNVVGEDTQPTRTGRLARRVPVPVAAACLGLKTRRRGGGRELGKRLGLAAFVFFFAKGLVWLAIAAGSYVALAN